MKKLFEELTEKEKKEILIEAVEYADRCQATELKKAKEDLACGNCHEDEEAFPTPDFCKRKIIKGEIIYVSKWMGLNCCSTNCTWDVFKSSMD